MAAVLTNIDQWIREHEKDFLPPVCNKMLHNTQLKVFYVGGPNQRKDFHLEEGEELFFMRKGDMELIILEKNEFRTVPIKEGEIFLLPGRIPHSPQRKAETVGLVIERGRLPSEKDAVRYFVEGSKDSLYERWFYCDDLGTQLGPLIREFFASEEYRTGRPCSGSLPECRPYDPDCERSVEAPFNFKNWLGVNRESLIQRGEKYLFDNQVYQSDVIVHGPKKRTFDEGPSETWLWQLEGSRNVDVEGVLYEVKEDNALLVPSGKRFTLEEAEETAITMSVTMNPANKHRLQQK